MDDVYFLRGTFGTGIAPAIVPPDENHAIDAAVREGMVLVEFALSCVIVLLDKIERTRVQYLNNTLPGMDILQCINKNVHCNINDYKQLCADLTNCDTIYAGKTYIIYNNYYDQRHPIGARTASMMSNAMLSIICSSMPCSVLCGHAQNLSTVMLTPLQLIDLKERVIICAHEIYGENEGSRTLVLADSNAKTLYVNCKRITTNKRRNVLRIVPDDRLIYIISVYRQRVQYKAKLEHLLCFPELITPEQAYAYCDIAPDDDAVTYDDIGDGIVGVCDA